MQTVLITGGSSGIGYELSKHFSENDYQILWVSKSETELKEGKAAFQKTYPETKVHTLVKDLTSNTAAQEVQHWANGIGEVNVLINNAGFGTHGYVQNIPMEKELGMIQLHVKNTYLLTRLFLDEMMLRNEGCIINISSITAFQPIPRMTTYAATKAFINHFTRGLQEELMIQGSKVQLISACPSAIKDTAFKDVADMNNVRTYDGLVATTAKEVAKDIWNGFQKGKPFIISGFKMRCLYILQYFLPYRLLQYLIQWESDKK